MNDSTTNKDLLGIKRILLANLVIMVGGVVGLVFGLLPKLERTTQVAEKLEARFQDFADEVQPVVNAGAGKAVESIKKMDADRLSKTATDKTDDLIDAASERAKRYFEKDKK